MRNTFIRTLQKKALDDPNILLITADLGFKLFDNYRATLPHQFINVGIAEQNMISLAAGLSLSGKNVYCYSMAPFLIMRAFEAIRVNLCSQLLNVKLIGVGGGLVYGLEGMTHHATEDIAIMRSLPNMTVTAPGDPFEAEAIVNRSVDYSGPLYIRLAGNNDPVVHRNEPDIVIGKGAMVYPGDDIAIFATGSMLHSANKAVEILRAKGFWPTLISLHTVKPLDVELIRKHASQSRAVFTVEEHSLIGGLGSAVAELLFENGYRGLFRKFALPDQYGQMIGRADYLLKTYELTPDALAKNILDELEGIKSEVNYGLSSCA